MSSSTLSPPFDSFRNALEAGELVTVDGVDDDSATLRLPADAFDFETVFTAAREADLCVTAITYDADNSQFTVTADRNVTLEPVAPTPSDIDELATALDAVATHRGETDSGNPRFGVFGSVVLQVHEVFQIARDHGYQPINGNVQTDLVEYIELEFEPAN